jgi:hypothetical protein
MSVNKRAVSQLFAFACAVVVTCVLDNSARAVTVPIDFSGPEQVLDVTASLTGGIGALATGTVKNVKTGKLEPFVSTPPTFHPIALDPEETTFSTNPKSVSPDLPPNLTSFDFTGDQLADINGFQLDVMGGTTEFLNSALIHVTTNSSILILQDIEVGVSATLDRVTFQQTSAASLSPTGAGTGTFSLPGLGYLHLGDGTVNIGGIIPLPFELFSIPAPITLEGTYKVSGPLGNAKVELDGSLFYVRELSPGVESSSLATGISAPLALTISATIEWPASSNLLINFHLEQSGLIIPEPASVVLVLIGLLAIAPVAWHRVRK